MPENPIFNPEDRTARYALPFLYPSQAHKEVTYNKALSHIDALLFPAIENIADSPDTVTRSPGRSWLISASPSGDWAGRAHHIAHWTGQYWQYILPVDGMQVFDTHRRAMIFFRENIWHSLPAPQIASGGDVADSEARIAISAIIAALNAAGITYLSD